jgi:hypothetical protein
MMGAIAWMERVGRFVNFHAPDGDTLAEQEERFRAERTPKPFPTELPAMLAELEEAFKDNPHWTGDGPITRPIVLMARIVAELSRRQPK